MFLLHVGAIFWVAPVRALCDFEVYLGNGRSPSPNAFQIDVACLATWRIAYLTRGLPKKSSSLEER